MQDFIAELNSMLAVRVSGVEKEDYLHGQLTIDTKSWSKGQARIAAHCDFKGKMWQQYFVINANDDFILLGHKDGCDASVKELKKYGVFAKVDIEIDQELFIVGASGEKAEADLKKVFDHLPSSHLASVETKNACITRIDLGKAYYLCVLDKEAKAAFDQNKTMQYSDEAKYEYLEISAGLGNIQESSCGEYVPQMFNLHLIDGIDFDKGCYMGQEVVARTKFLGKNKRALYILEAGSLEDKVAVGDQIEKRLNDNWRRAGNIVRVASDNGTTRILAILPNDTNEQDVLRLKGSEAQVKILPHPYTFSTD